MSCRKCKSENVDIQMVSELKKKKKGLFYWIFFIWIIDILTWIWFFGIRLIMRIFKRTKYKSKTYKMAICQSCGYSWKI